MQKIDVANYSYDKKGNEKGLFSIYKNGKQIAISNSLGEVELQVNYLKDKQKEYFRNLHIDVSCHAIKKWKFRAYKRVKTVNHPKSTKATEDFLKLQIVEIFLNSIEVNRSLINSILPLSPETIEKNKNCQFKFDNKHLLLFVYVNCYGKIIIVTVMTVSYENFKQHLIGVSV